MVVVCGFFFIKMCSLIVIQTKNYKTYIEYCIFQTIPTFLVCYLCLLMYAALQIFSLCCFNIWLGLTLSGDRELDFLKQRLQETEKAMERIVAKMMALPHGSEVSFLHASRFLNHFIFIFILHTLSLPLFSVLCLPFIFTINFSVMCPLHFTVFEVTCTMTFSGFVVVCHSIFLLKRRLIC